MDFWTALEWFIKVCEQIGQFAVVARLLMLLYLWLTVGIFFILYFIVLLLNLDALKKLGKKGNKLL